MILSDIGLLGKIDFFDDIDVGRNHSDLSLENQL